MQNSVIIYRITTLYGSQPSSVVLWMQNSMLSTRMTSLYGFQPSPVVLCLQNSDFRTRLTSLNVSQSSSVDLCRHNGGLSTEYQVYMGFSPHLWFCACKTAWLPLKLLVSTCPRPHLCIIANKRACHTIPYGSQTSPVDLWMQNSVPSTRTTILYWFQPSPVILCLQNSAFRTRITSLYVSQTSSVHFCKQNSLPYKSLWVPDFTCGFLNAKHRP